MSWAPRPTLVVLGLTVALVIGFQASFTWQSYLGVGAISAVTLWYGLFRNQPRIAPPARLSARAVALYAVPVLAFSALEIVDDALGSNRAHPTLSSLFDPIFAVPMLRFLGVALWLYAGWQLVRR